MKILFFSTTYLTAVIVFIVLFYNHSSMGDIKSMFITSWPYYVICRVSQQILMHPERNKPATSKHTHTYALTLGLSVCQYTARVRKLLSFFSHSLSPVAKVLISIKSRVPHSAASRTLFALLLFLSSEPPSLTNPSAKSFSYLRWKN